MSDFFYLLGSMASALTDPFTWAFIAFAGVIAWAPWGYLYVPPIAASGAGLKAHILADRWARLGFDDERRTMITVNIGIILLILMTAAYIIVYVGRRRLRR